MTARNDITGDAIKTKSSSEAYRDRWDLAFKKDCEEAFDQVIGTEPPHQDDFDFVVGGYMFGQNLAEAIEESKKIQEAADKNEEVYDQWKIDAENIKRLNDLTQED